MLNFKEKLFYSKEDVETEMDEIFWHGWRMGLATGFPLGVSASLGFLALIYLGYL